MKNMAKKRSDAHGFFRRICSGYYNALLLLLFLLFVFRPYPESAFYLPVWKFLLVATMLLSIFNSKHIRWVQIVCKILAAPAVILSWMYLLNDKEEIFIANAVVTIIFMALSAFSILYDVILRARVTLETLRGVICAYFMVAFAFAYIYVLIEYVNPGTFHLSNEAIAISSYSHYLSQMLYFSFVTLLTIGYGDITAVKDVGQTAAVIEGILGQFYIAILVARIVSVYAFHSDKHLLKSIEHDLKKMQ